MYLAGQQIVCEAQLDFQSQKGGIKVEPYTRLTVQTVGMEQDGELIIIFKEYPTYKFPLMKYFKPVDDLTEDEIKSK